MRSADDWGASRTIDNAFSHLVQGQVTPKSESNTEQKESSMILTIFTTWDARMESEYVYNNTVKVLASLLPEIQLVIFLPEEKIASYNVPEGWHVLPISLKNCGGPPVLKNMFFDVYDLFDSTFYGYVNADILFNRGLVDTLYTLRKSQVYKSTKQVLISGKRVDLMMERYKLRHISSANEVDGLVRKGAIAHGYAEDFFITTRQFPWQHIPDLVIGRPKYDNFLLYMARLHNVPVVDVSMTVVALHQRTSKRKKSKDECNERILKKAKKYHKKYIKWGNLECATFETRYDRSGNISVFRRGQFSMIC